MLVKLSFDHTSSSLTTQKSFDLVDQIKQLSGSDSVQLLGDGDLQKQYREYFKQDTDDQLRMINTKIDLDRKIIELESLCSAAANLNSFLQTQERDTSGCLPGIGKSHLIEFPDLNKDLKSQSWRCSDLAKGTLFPVPTDWSKKAADIAAICLPKQDVNWDSVLSDYIEPKYRPFQGLYEEGLTYGRFKEIISPAAIEALKSPDHIETWNRIRDRIEEEALNAIRVNHQTLQRQIIDQLRQRCEFVDVHQGNLSISISNCSDTAFEANSSTSMYKLGFFAIVFVGGLFALWATRGQEKKSDFLKDQMIQLSRQSEEKRSEFLDKVDAQLQTGNQVEQFQSDRDRLAAMVNEGRESEWSKLSVEFKAFLYSCLNA